MKSKPRPPIYAVLAEFDSPEALVAAAGKTIARGYRKVEANSPFPVEGLDEALGFHHSRVPLITLIGGVIGCVGGFFMEWYSAVKHYPMNIGGRPLNSWPAFIPIAFELTILCAAIAAVLGMLALNGLPMPYHPLFNVERFERASRDRFFLCIEATDLQFNREATKQFLESLNPHGVYEVEH
jgi:ActD protein